MSDNSFTTQGGVAVRRESDSLDYEHAIEPLIDALDTQRGVLLASSFEYPGRYTRWDIGFVDPPIEVTCRGRRFTVKALNDRGAVLLPAIARAIAPVIGVERLAQSELALNGEVLAPLGGFPEEERSRQPTVFSVLRAIRDLFFSAQDGHLGLYGAFGYDLAFQFDPVTLRMKRAPNHRDLVLYLPDEILVVDHRRAAATRHHYVFVVDGDRSTSEEAGGGVRVPFQTDSTATAGCDHAPGAYADMVRTARKAFARGDMFEVVPGQMFLEPCAAPPSELFRRLRARNPAPYGALMNLGESEYLVAASPEMFVRVEGRRVETCPISGTIARGCDAVEDAAQILKLLNSAKDESELTMCTDVDRNDKSRICEPGSVRIIGRRQIEIYSRLIHTVDHVEGVLRDGFDALDAFLTHCWAVTVTGAPKLRAMQFIEDHERSPRRWYGGAIGVLGFDGNLNTGLTLRTVRIKDGVAEIRAGATLLYDSDPDAEEAETHLKASALLSAIRGEASKPAANVVAASPAHFGRRVLMIDHRDSFVHTLAGYLRETGAEVLTLRHDAALEALDRVQPDLAILSPGPGKPEDFEMSRTIAALVDQDVPIFGVCLGMQGIVEHFGGKLGTLSTPVHGKPSRVRAQGGGLFEGLPTAFTAGRYHSLFAEIESLPQELDAVARSDDGVVMAVEHRDLPVAGVQFHPESLMTLADDVGRRLIANVMEMCRAPDAASSKVRSAAQTAGSAGRSTARARR